LVTKQKNNTFRPKIKRWATIPEKIAIEYSMATYQWEQSSTYKTAQNAQLRLHTNTANIIRHFFDRKLLLFDDR
jgi:hypothetical protein